jgi:hypothetical protein
MPSDELKEKIAHAVRMFENDVEQQLAKWDGQRSPAGFRDTEMGISEVCRKLQDGITEVILRNIVYNPSFQAQCSSAARTGGSSLRIGERQGRDIVLLGGSTIRLEELEYLKPNRRGTKGRKRKNGKRGKGGSGSGLLPVLAALGIWFGATPALCEEVCRQVADSDSLRCARAALERRSIRLGHNKIRNLVNRVSRRTVDQRSSWLKQIRECDVSEHIFKGKRVVVAPDGGRIRTRVSAKRGRRRENGHRGYKAPWREPKLFVIYLINDKGKVEGEFRPIYDGTLGDADAMFEMLESYLKALGVHNARQVIFVGDGAKWIWKRTSVLANSLGLPPDRVVEVVDWFHTVEVLWDVAKLPKKWSDIKRDKWVRKAKKLLFAGHIDALVALIKPITTNQRPNQKKQAKPKKDNDHLDYFMRNAARMQYKTFELNNIPLGSGAVESAVRRVINMRMKSNGTFWLDANAEGMVLLRCYLKAGRFENLSRWALSFASSWWPPAQKYLSLFGPLALEC